MEDERVVPTQEEKATSDKTEGSKFAWKYILFGLGAIALIALVGGGAYWFGTQRVGAPEPSPRPEDDQPLADTPTPTPSPTLTSTSTPTPTPTPVIKTKTITSTVSLDGFRSSNGGGNDSVDVRAGRNIFLVTRGFVSFDLSGIPAGSTITEATLRLYQYDTNGSPYGVGGSLKVDHLNYGDALDNTDYGMAALLSSFTTLTSNTVIEWKDADVTDQVKDDVANGRSRSQYRIHFTTENKGGDVTGDFAYFESAENTGGTGKKPQLVVKYY
jgi:hypothetical protein